MELSSDKKTTGQQPGKDLKMIDTAVLLPENPVNRCGANDRKSSKRCNDGLPLPLADLYDLSPTAIRAVEHLAACKFKEPFNGMKPVAALYFSSAIGTGERCKGSPEVKRPHIRKRPLGIELHNVLKMGMIGKKIEVF